MTYSPLEVLIAVDRNGRLRARISQFCHEAGRDSVMRMTGSRDDVIRMLTALLPFTDADMRDEVDRLPGDPVLVTHFDVGLLRGDTPAESD